MPKKNRKKQIPIYKVPSAEIKKDKSVVNKKNKIVSFVSTGFDIKALLQICAISVAITAIYFVIRNFNKKEESEKSKVSLQMGIQPTNQLDSTGRHYYYESWYMFINNGQSTTKTANIFWFLNNSIIDYSSKPYLIGPSHGVEINIIETTTPGFCEFNIKNLPPGVGFLIGVRHRIKKEYVDEIYKSWTTHMFDKEFTNYFLSEVSISGEKVSIKNNGAYDLQNMEKE